MPLRIETEAMCAAAYASLGVIAQRRGDYDLAIAWYRSALAILEISGVIQGRAMILGNLRAIVLAKNTESVHELQAVSECERATINAPLART